MDAAQKDAATAWPRRLRCNNRMCGAPQRIVIRICRSHCRDAAGVSRWSGRGRLEEGGSDLGATSMARATAAAQPPSCAPVRMLVHQHVKLKDHRLSWGLAWQSIRNRHCDDCPSDHPVRASTSQTKPTRSRDRHRRIFRACTSVPAKPTRQTMLPIRLNRKSGRAGTSHLSNKPKLML